MSKGYSLKKDLLSEYKKRTDAVKYEYQRLSECGVNENALKIIIKHAYYAGIVADKLENIKIHDILAEKG